MSNNFLQDIENITSSIIPDFSGLSWFVQYLTSRGEDPIAFISTLVFRIGGRASAVAVMTEFVAGVMEYGGIEGFAEVQAQKIIQPLINTLHIYSNTGNQLATLHQHTTTTVQTKLQALTTRETASAVPLQGDISNAMLTSLSTVTNRLNTISSALGSPQDQINQDFVNSIGTYLKGVAVIDLAILSMEVIVSLGVVTIPFELVLDGSVLLVELLGLIGLVAAEGGVWLYRSITLHAQQQQSFDDSQSSSLTYGGSPYGWQENGGKLKVDPPQNQYPGPFKTALIAALTAAGAYGTKILEEQFLSLSQSIQNQLFSDLAHAYNISPAALATYLNYSLQKNPHITVLQLLDALSVRSTMARDQMLINDINSRVNDPRYTDAKDSLLRLQRTIQGDIKSLQKQENTILSADYPQLALTDPKKWKDFRNSVNSADANFRGSWGNWQLAKYYGDQGKLVFVDQHVGGVPEVDIAIRDGNSMRFIQVKAYSGSFTPQSSSYGGIDKNLRLTQQVINDPNAMKELQKRYKWFDGKATTELNLINTQGNGDWSQTVAQVHKDFPTVKVHTTSNPPSSDVDYTSDPSSPLYNSSVRDSITQLPTLPDGWDPLSVGRAPLPKATPTP